MRAEHILSRYSDAAVIQVRKGDGVGVIVSVGPHDAGHVAAFGLAVASRERDAVVAIIEDAFAQRLAEKALHNMEHAPETLIAFSREEMQGLLEDIRRLVIYERGPLASEVGNEEAKATAQVSVAE